MTYSTYSNWCSLSVYRLYQQDRACSHCIHTDIAKRVIFVKDPLAPAQCVKDKRTCDRAVHRLQCIAQCILEIKLLICSADNVQCEYDYSTRHRTSLYMTDMILSKFYIPLLISLSTSSVRSLQQNEPDYSILYDILDCNRTACLMECRPAQYTNIRSLKIISASYHNLILQSLKLSLSHAPLQY